MLERVLQCCDDVFTQKGELRMVLVIEGQTIGLACEQPAQHPAAQVERDEGFRS